MNGKTVGGNSPFNEVVSSSSVAEMREKLGSWLGVQHPVSEEVLTAALVHPGYARKLAVARESPEAVAHLLASPPALPRSAARMAGVTRRLPEHRTSTLLRQLATSAIRWSASGFSVVDDRTRERRWEACLACPHLVAPPKQKAAYSAVALLKPEAKICAICGCFAGAKVRLQHEQCPDMHPTIPGRSRWDESRSPSE